jgi:O-antigen ligase
MFVSIWIYLAVDFVGLKYYVDVITSILNFTDNRSNLERLYQYNSLKTGILDAPLVGYGAGAVAHYVRSTTWPWLYELYYLAFIFQYGIIGFSIYALGVAFLCLELLRAVKKKGRSSFEYYLLSGFIAFMLANATNPYLPSFDFMWIIFIPYAIVNRRLCSGRYDKAIVSTAIHSS